MEVTYGSAFSNKKFETLLCYIKTLVTFLCVDDPSLSLCYDP